MKKLILIAFLIAAVYINAKAQHKTGPADFAGTNYSKNKTLTTMVSSSIAVTSFGPDKNYDFYMHRSKNERIVGWSTLGGGLLLGAAGILAASSEKTYNNGKNYLPGVLFVASAASGLVSIPFMVLASVNKNKAKALLSSQKTGFGVPKSVSNSIVGITLTIQLGS